jgi:glycosyltransferase involved in cell wall biosynthesis
MGWDKSRRKLGFLGGADAVIAVSAACAASVERFVGRDRLHVVHNGVDLTEYRTASPPADVDTSVPGAPVVLSVGHVKPLKAQLEAVRAFSLVAAEVSEAELWFVGATDRDADYVDLLREEIQRRDLGASVRLLGFRRDIPDLLARSAVCLHTARSEAHGRAVVEAMAAGVPAVAFASGGPEESIEHGETGFVVPFGDIESLAGYMLRLLRDGALHDRMGSAARKRAETHFSAAATAERIDTILQTIVAGESDIR